ncbi:hypothetical protein B0E43_20255 [Algoriphagus sp. A40]|nr:hypothetical protein B0E43_20255 [Algoriphagus sp. A40]
MIVAGPRINCGIFFLQFLCGRKEQKTFVILCGLGGLKRKIQLIFGYVNFPKGSPIDVLALHRRGFGSNGRYVFF